MKRGGGRSQDALQCLLDSVPAGMAFTSQLLSNLNCNHFFSILHSRQCDVRGCLPESRRIPHFPKLFRPRSPPRRQRRRNSCALPPQSSSSSPPISSPSFHPCPQKNWRHTREKEEGKKRKRLLSFLPSSFLCPSCLEEEEEEKRRSSPDAQPYVPQQSSPPLLPSSRLIFLLFFVRLSLSLLHFHFPRGRSKIGASGWGNRIGRRRGSGSDRG